MLAMTLITGNAIAENDDVVAICAEKKSTDERILCLENAIRNQSNAHRTPIDQDSEKSVAIQPAASAARLTMQKSAAVSSKATPTEDLKSAPSGDHQENDEIEIFGLTAREKEPAPLTAIDVSVVAVTENAYGKSVFVTANGQKWLQTDQRSVRFPQLPVDATIRKGASGSFFLQPREGGVAVRVRRNR